MARTVRDAAILLGVLLLAGLGTAVLSWG
jgi:hypothetical protein